MSRREEILQAAMTLMSTPEKRLTFTIEEFSKSSGFCRKISIRHVGDIRTLKQLVAERLR